MRTTLNIDEDVAQLLSERSRRDGRSLSRVANELIRAGLRMEQERPATTPYEPPVFQTGRSSVDFTDVAQALERADDLG
jgi:hypothetical protein